MARRPDTSPKRTAPAATPPVEAAPALPVSDTLFRRTLLLTLVLYALLQSLYITATPLQTLTLPDNLPQRGAPESRQLLTGIGPDEKEHFLYILSLANRARLPAPTPAYRSGPDEYVSYQAQHPPLFYALAAVFVEIVEPLAGRAGVWYFLRFLCAVCGGFVVVFAARAARTLFPAEPLLALGCGPFVAFLPMFGHMTGNLSNEPLAMAFGAWAWFLSAQIAARAGRENTPPTLRDGLLLGAAVGLALLTRLTALVWLPAVVIALLFAARRTKSNALVPLGAFAGVVAVLLAPYLLYNLAHFGTPVLRTFSRPLLARGTLGEFLGGGITPAEFPVPVSLFYSLLWYASTAWTPFWLQQFYVPGGLRAAPNWQRLFLAVEMLTLLGLLLRAAKAREEPQTGERAAQDAMLWGGAGAIGLCALTVLQQELWGDWNVVLSAGRYFVAAAPAGGVLFLTAAGALLGARRGYTGRRPAAAFVASGLMFLFAVSAVTLVRRFYTDNPRQEAVQTIKSSSEGVGNERE